MRKRKFDKLEGMTQPDKRKRRRSKKVNGSVEEPTGAVASKAAALDRPRELVETGADAPPKTLATELRAAADQLSAGTAVAARSVDTLAGADKPSGDTEPITLGDDIHSRCTSTSLARRDIAEGVTNVGSLEFFPESASRDDVTGTSKGGALSAGQTSLVTDISTPSSFAATERWRTVDRTQLVPYPSPSLSGLLQPEDALRIMSSVLLHCASQHHRIGKFGGQSVNSTGTTSIAEVRAITKQVAGLEYEAAVRSVAKRNALQVGNDLQSNSDENIYWEIILKGAKLLDPATLPVAKGPWDGFSMAEKTATYDFMNSGGFGTCLENQRQCRGLWKTLFDIRRVGVEMITCYRTAEFNKYCKTYPKRSDISLIDTIVSWEKAYRPHIAQLESRVFEQRNGDFSGRSWLRKTSVAERLDITESSWNDASNDWYSSDEETTFKLTTAFRASSSRSLSSLFNDRALREPCRNKSIYITLEPKGDRFLSVCPIIPVVESDFLGIFSGTIRFSEDINGNHSIPGPTRNLSLDYSQVTGMLNQMQVSKPDGDANVCLEWEPVNEMDEKGPCVSWRVLVFATKAIMPFEPLIRAAPRKQQFLLHQASEYAKRGFTKRQLIPQLKA
ncbi:hypothetical protein BGZ57DRAFT_913151 [Hyaloscypha finlandica]|nr:hypothetical protein BGZ57DRAFT_913151 [Hyaloscypha finlandica]